MNDFDMHSYVYADILRELTQPYPGNFKAMRVAAQLIEEYKPGQPLDFDDYEQMAKTLPPQMEVRLMEELL